MEGPENGPAEERPPKGESHEEVRPIAGTARDRDDTGDDSDLVDVGSGDAPRDPESLEKALEERSREARESRDKVLRLAAELENLRKRTQREMEEHKKYANAGIISGLLPVLDNYRTALKQAEGSGLEDRESFLKGFRMIYDSMLETLKAEGLTEIEALGRQFDPFEHEAVDTLHTEEHPPETVVEEIQKGYRYKDKVLRPALVRVCAGPPTECEPEREGEDEAEDMDTVRDDEDGNSDS